MDGQPLKQNSTMALLYIMFLTSILIRVAKSDPDLLTDFCIADANSTQQWPVFFNGVPCLNPALALSSHFMTSILSKPGNTSANPFKFNVTTTNTKNLPGSNAQGLAMARIDIAVNGLVPPHAHPRASEVTVLLRGMLLVGFVDTSDRLFAQQLWPGDAFVFPQGMIHFLYNLDPSAATLAVSGFSSQNPGVQLSLVASFMSNPPIMDEVLKKSYMISGQDIQRIRKNLGGA